MNTQSLKIQIENEKNINRLVNSKYGRLKKHKIINLSFYVIDDNEANAVSYGLYFAVPP